MGPTDQLVWFLLIRVQFQSCVKALLPKISSRYELRSIINFWPHLIFYRRTDMMKFNLSSLQTRLYLIHKLYFESYLTLRFETNVN